MGRPRIHCTPELAETFCNHIAAGMTVRQACEQEGMPSTSTVRRWIATDEEFRTAYLIAKDGMMEDMLEQILEIANDGSKDNELVEGADGMPAVKPNKESIGRAQLRIDTYFRVLAKLSPSKYGDAKLMLTAEPVTQSQNGDGAKVIEGEVIPLENHPLFASIEAWVNVVKAAK
jgi:hypothetical protein